MSGFDDPYDDLDRLVSELNLLEPIASRSPSGDTSTLEGWLARVFYVSLYRMHQMALYGVPRTLLLMLSDRIGRSTEPRLKLH